MQQKQTFSAQPLALSVAAAELGRAIFGAGQTGSVRAVLLAMYWRQRPSCSLPRSSRPTPPV